MNPPAPPQPAAGSHTVRVFQVLAANRLLPKEGWSLSRELCTAVPFVKARLSATKTRPIVVTNILEGITKRPLTVELEGDFTNYALALPQTTVRLDLVSFKGRLSPLPSGLRCLHLSISSEAGVDMVVGDVLALLRNAAAIISSAPLLEELRLCGPDGYGGDRVIVPLSAVVRTPMALKIVELEFWDVESWEPIQLLLSPEAETLRFIGCSFYSRERIMVPPLPEQLVTLEFQRCYAHQQIVFDRLPLTLCRASIMMSGLEAVFTHGLPPGLKSLALGNRQLPFNVPAQMLPESLEELTLVGCERLESLPPRLRVLRMSEYDRQLPTLPDTLETLELDNCRHETMRFPDRLHSLSLSWDPTMWDPRMAPPRLPTVWPPLLEHLTYWTTQRDVNAQPLIEMLPLTLRSLHINGCRIAHWLQHQLREVCTGAQFTQPVQWVRSVRVSLNRQLMPDVEWLHQML
eukprot:TRINITY_DN1743_c1_g2_i1.p1 TRINITY_DN1743_c1_g2~~TRINITY_DN1743_c1_g2_i1.p1  ORF type:complete len:461 (+),score=10.16 TRINITY_DN1743_c1_g2_i1:59-1441(+)